MEQEGDEIIYRSNNRDACEGYQLEDAYRGVVSRIQYNQKYLNEDQKQTTSQCDLFW
ncbi:MAG: hypothetical protein R2827_14875 [Bdellovibrionales bacterium]